MPGSTDWASENKVVLQSIKTPQMSPGVPPNPFYSEKDNKVRMILIIASFNNLSQTKYSRASRSLISRIVRFNFKTSFSTTVFYHMQLYVSF